MAIQVEYVSIGDLKNYEKNARTHSSEQVDQLVASIENFGFTNPVLIDENNYLIAGHGRTMAAKKIGMDSVPAIRLSDLTDEKIKALRIADNQLALNAGWDLDLLSAELQELSEMDFDLDLLGFDDDFLNELLEDDDLSEETGEEEAMPPAPPADPVNKPGDIWVMGKHRLMCGDSTSIDAVDDLLGGKECIADMIFTDPPYLMDFTGGIHADGSKSFNASHGAIKNDKMSKQEGDDFLDAINTIIKAKVEGAFYITFYRLGIDWYFESMQRVGLKYRSLIIWDKGNHTLSNSDYMSMYEPMFYGWVNSHNFYGGNNGMDIWRIQRTQKNELHPTMKPVELVEKAIEHGSKKGQVVLNLFGGSGTTMIACENFNRMGRLMELDPKYCDVIIERWQNHTGRKARLETTGQTYDELVKGKNDSEVVEVV